MRLVKTFAQAVLAGVALLAGAHGACAAAGELPPAEDYVRRPAIRDIAISPAGTHLAFAMATPGARSQLAVLDLTALGPAKLLAKFSDADVTWVQWVNNDRLVFQVARFDVAANDLRAGGLLGINRDGSGVRELIAAQWAASSTGTNIASRVLPWQWSYFDAVDDGSPDILVSEDRYDIGDQLQSVLLSRLNTATGIRRLLTEGVPENAQDWLVDGRDQPRVLAAHKGGRTTVYWRSEADKAWTPIAEFGAYPSNGFIPTFIDEKGQLYVLAHNSRDTQALYQFDPVLKKMEPEPTIALQGFDLKPALVVNSATHSLLGLHIQMEQGGSYWFDKDLREIQRNIDTAMPAGRVNRLWCGRCAGSRYFVVESSSDREPGEYYLLDRDTWKLQFIASSRPWIKEATQGPRSFHRVAARDGLSLPVYLTRPAAAPAGKALPAVVLVHGGPYMRGHDLRWDGEAQFLASRGYLVIEVEFRGSTGYGSAHFQAGFKQWGLAMQDDLADAVAWAVKQGLVDSGRVCIMGGSYGGYAALMGPIRSPGVYQCAISFAGVTDIELMYDIHWSDFSDEWKQYGMPILVGDRQKDAEQLKNTSPLQQVSRIKVPLLVSHGGQDQRVPVEHVRKFLSAAEKAGVQVEWVPYPDEMHGFRKEANAADYLKRVEAFLARALGAPKAAKMDQKAGAP